MHNNSNHDRTKSKPTQATLKATNIAYVDKKFRMHTKIKNTRNRRKSKIHTLR